MSFLRQAGLGVNSMWPFCVYEVDDANALWMTTQAQPLSLCRLTNKDYGNVNGVATYSLGQSFSTGMKMADNTTAIPANGNWDNVKSIGSGVMLGVVTSSGNSKSYVLRSHNYGASWGTNDNNDRAAVLNLGDTAVDGKSDGSTQGTLINALGTRGICKATIAGQTVILIGEYNTNAAANTDPVAAGAQVRVWISRDLGKTWSVLLTFNTNTGGNRQVRHCHYIGQDPHSGYIYFGFGDSATSAIIRWDGVSAAPAANTLPENFGNTPGWLGIGAGNWTNYRNNSGQTNVDVWQVTDLIFMPNYILNPADNGDSAAVNRGIWKFNRDFTGLSRVYANTAHTGHSNYWAIKHSSGMLYEIEILEVTSSDGILYIHASNDDGLSWYECAKFPFKASLTGSVDAWFERLSDGSIWCSTGQGKTAVPAANRSSYQLFPTQLFSPISAVSGG